MLSGCSTNWKSCLRLQLKCHLYHYIKSKTITVSTNDFHTTVSLTGLTISLWQRGSKSSEWSTAWKHDIIDDVALTHPCQTEAVKCDNTL